MKSNLSSLCQSCGLCCQTMVLPVPKPLDKAIFEDWIDARGCEIIGHAGGTIYVKIDHPCPHLNKSDEGYKCDQYFSRPEGCRIFDGRTYSYLNCAWKKSVPKKFISHVILEKARSHKYIKRLGTPKKYQYVYEIKPKYSAEEVGKESKLFSTNSNFKQELASWVKEHPHDTMKLYHGTTANHIYNILFEGVKPQSFHNFEPRFYKEGRDNQVFVTDTFLIAKVFATTAERKTGSPAVILEADIPADEWSKAVYDNMGGGGWGITKVKPEWIKNVYDKDGNPMTKTIDSLTLKRFEKAGKLYIPVSLAVLKKILNRRINEERYIGESKKSQIY